MNKYSEIHNKIINKHAEIIDGKLKSSARMSHNQFKTKAVAKEDTKSGLMDRIGVKMVQHGIFVEKGVGRGRGINSGKTSPQPWFNPVIEEAIPPLADELELQTADLLVKTLIR